MQDIFLSPHYDDIAFSLSSFFHKNDIIINIFTESNYIENKKYEFINVCVRIKRKRRARFYIKK